VTPNADSERIIRLALSDPCSWCDEPLVAHSGLEFKGCLESLLLTSEGRERLARNDRSAS
jgi:hypothetical protein